MAYEVYTYGNAEAFIGTFNAIASMMGADTFTGAMHLATLLGAFTVLIYGVFGRGLMVPIQWLLGINVITLALFAPRSDVIVVDRLSVAPSQVVSGVPFMLAHLAHDITLLGDKLTGLTETAFQVIPDANVALPQTLSYQRNGVMFGSRLIIESRKAGFRDPRVRTDFVTYVRDCLVPDFNTGYKDPAAFAQNTDLWAAMGDTNPARYTYVGGDVRTCPEAYNNLNGRLPDEVGAAMSRVAMTLAPALPQADAVDKFTAEVPDAVVKGALGNAAADAGALVRQNAIINMLNDSYIEISRQNNDPASVLMATAEATISAQTNASWITSGKLAEAALPKFRGIAQALSYALFPFVIILGLAVPIQMFGKLFAGWVRFMAALELWPPLYAILNYFGTLGYATAASAAASFGTGTGGLAVSTAGAIYDTAISNQAIIGYISLSIPVIAWALVNQMQGIMQAFAAGVAVQHAVHGTAGQMAVGNVGMGNITMDQQGLAPHRTNPFMRTTQDEYGTTYQSSATTGASAFQMLKNSSPLSGAMSQRRASELSTAAGQSMEAGHGETVTAATQATAALGNLVSRSREKVDTTSLDQSWGKGEAGEFSQTHSYVRGMGQDLSRRFNIDESDATSVILGANAGLSFGASTGASQRLSQNMEVPGTGNSVGGGATKTPGVPGSVVDARGRDAGTKLGVNLGVKGDLHSDYRSSLQRAYDEVAKNTSSAQADMVNRYAQRLVHDETARKAVAASDKDAESATAQLSTARSHAEAAEAHYRQGESLQEQARVVSSSEGSLGYDWAADPANGRVVKTMVGQMREAMDRAGPNPQARMAAAQDVLRHNEALLTTPWNKPATYGNGQAIQWGEQGLRDRYGQYRAAPQLQDDTAEAHRQNKGKMAATKLDGDGVVRLGAPNIKPLQTAADGGVSAIKNKTGKAYETYDEAGGAAKRRFEGKAFDPRDETLKNRDAEFGSYASTADRAAGNAARDGARSLENAAGPAATSWLKGLFK